MKTITNIMYAGIALFAFASFALAPQARAVCQQGCGLANNTFLGDNALINNTTGQFNTATGSGALSYNTTGNYNTAIGGDALSGVSAFPNTGSYNVASGYQALFFNETGSYNTASGYQALMANDTASSNTATGANALNGNGVTGSGTGNNTATGASALFKNANGYYNTATGSGALYNNQTGGENTATGTWALFNNSGSFNTATGAYALDSNTTGANNTANGVNALFRTSTGGNNTADGVTSLYYNVGGHDNTAGGYQALLNNTGSSNIGLGSNGGANLTTGNNNIDIGNVGVAGEAGKVRIGTAGTHTATFVAGIYNVSEGGTIKPVYINSSGRLGTQPPASARKFKEEIKAMEKSSEGILKLKPVTFRYKNDAERTPQFGLIAEDVANVNRDLVMRDENGEIYTVRYDAVNAMLLNEFLKEHQTVQQQQKEIDALKAELKEQRALIQAVNDKVELSKPAPQTVLNNK